jgi:hypothetical protein
MQLTAFYFLQASAFGGSVRRRERLKVAVSRRLGDEIHPWLLNGDLRPFLVSRDLIVERPLCSVISTGRGFRLE